MPNCTRCSLPNKVFPNAKSPKPVYASHARIFYIDPNFLPKFNHYLPLPPYLCGKFWDRYGIQKVQIFIGRGFQLS